MRVSELIELLQEMPEDAEVRLAQQPSWPFEYSIGTVAAIGVDDGCVDEYEDEGGDDPAEPIVYIGEGTQLAYLPGAASRALGWK